jgi:RNA polymerase sigma-70 factor (ECF subfamily)
MSCEIASARAGDAAARQRTAQNTDRLWAAWMAAALAGDRASYSDLLRSCIPFIERVLRKQGVRADVIDDIVQETLLSVHRARRHYDPARSFTAWLRTIAQRRAVDEIRRAIRIRAREVHAPRAYDSHPDPVGGPEFALTERHRSGLIQAAIRLLPPGQRAIVEDVGVRGHSPARVAASSGRTAGAVRASWHRAIRSLRAQFNEGDVLCG